MHVPLCPEKAIWARVPDTCAPCPFSRLQEAMIEAAVLASKVQYRPVMLDCTGGCHSDIGWRTALENFPVFESWRERCHHNLSEASRSDALETCPQRGRDGWSCMDQPSQGDHGKGVPYDSLVGECGNGKEGRVEA